MNQSAHMRLTLLAALTALVFVGIAGLFTTSTSALIGLTAEAFQQPGLPVQISEVGAHSNNVTKESLLTYSVENLGQTPIMQLRVIALQFGQRGVPRGGQMTVESLNLPPGATQQRELRLSNLLYVHPTREFARIVLAVESVQTAAQSWRAAGDVSDLVAGMKGESAAPAVQSFAITQEFEVMSCECTQFCGPTGTCARLAEKACGRVGVSELSCSCGGTCSCSFRCNPA